MDTHLRIRTIRLQQRMAADPEYAKRLGLSQNIRIQGGAKHGG